MENLSGLGSTIYSGVWKLHVTPAGRSIFRLRVSAQRTSDSAPSSERSGWPTPMANNATKDCNRFREDRQNGLGAIASLSGWATPTTRDHKNTGNLETYIFGSPTGRVRDDSTSTQAYLAGWPTPTVGNADGSQMAKDASPTGRRPDGSKATVNLNGVAQTAGWPTPRSADGEKNVRSETGSAKEMERKGGPQDLMQGATLAGWPTPIVNDTTGSTHCYGRDKSILLKLPGAAKQAGWPTPNASDGNGGKGPRAGVSMTGRMPDGSKITMDLSAATKLSMDHNGPARITADGQMLTGSSAAMESGGQLNPAHSRWLMGYPPAWCDCAVTATPSSRKRRQSSSKA